MRGDDDPGMAASAPRGPRRRRRPAWAIPRPTARSIRCSPPAARDQLVTRQIHEPLVATLAGPFGDARRLPGLAASFSSSAGRHDLELPRARGGAVSGRGSPLNAGAVLANGRALAHDARGPAGDARPLRGRRPAPGSRSLLPRAPRPATSPSSFRCRRRESSRRARSTSPRATGRRSSGSRADRNRARSSCASAAWRRRSSPATWRGGERSATWARRWIRFASGRWPTPTSASRCSPRATCRSPTRLVPSRRRRPRASP